MDNGTDKVATAFKSWRSQFASMEDEYKAERKKAKVVGKKRKVNVLSGDTESLECDPTKWGIDACEFLDLGVVSWNGQRCNRFSKSSQFVT